MGRYKTKLQAIYEANKRILGETKKTKKEKDSKYTKWCKENEYEMGKKCADAALDSDESSIRAWGVGFLMGNKGMTFKEQYDPYAHKKYDPATDEWVGKEDTYDGWQQLKRVLYDYEKGLKDEELETHIKNLKSHLQELTYILNNR